MVQIVRRAAPRARSGFAVISSASSLNAPLDAVGNTPTDAELHQCSIEVAPITLLFICSFSITFGCVFFKLHFTFVRERQSFSIDGLEL